jgi:outer membrane protein
MKTLLALTLASACGAVFAQTPASNPMPDGSYDSYVGLGLVAAQDYPGAGERRVRVRPLLQFETSHGIFISGMSAGMHLSRQPSLEYGPLLALDPGRDADGENGGAGGVTDPVNGFGVRPVNPVTDTRQRAQANALAGMRDVKPRLLVGGFANVYLNPEVRLTSTLLYGAGHEQDGLVASFGVQRMAAAIAPHHKVTLSAGITVVNGSHNASYFGVTKDEAAASGYAHYAPRGGIRDAWAGAGWNWALSPSWMLASGVRLTLLKGDARHSPLVNNAANFTVNTGLAYRF